MIENIDEYFENELDTIVRSFKPPVLPKTSINLKEEWLIAYNTLQKFVNTLITSYTFSRLGLCCIPSSDEKVIFSTEKLEKFLEITINYFADYETEVTCTEGYEFVVKHYGNRVCNQTIRARTYKDLLKTVADFLLEWQ